MNKIPLRKAVILPMGILFILIIVLGLINPKGFFDVENAIVDFAFNWFGWLFQISGNIFLFILIWIICSRHGNIKLGGADAKPIMGWWNWFAISLCAGIATGIVFWGIAEPITHFMNPPAELGLEAGSEAAAMFSMVTTYIHWTYIPYAMYGLAGLAVAFAAFNMKLPYHISSTLYPIFGRSVKKFGPFIDNLSIVAMAGGIAAVLGVAATQIGSGLQQLFGITPGKTVSVIILAVIVATYIISSYTGINKGIRILSDQNAKIFIGLMVFTFIFGGIEIIKFIPAFGTQAIGHFIQNFFERTHYLSPVDGSAWPRWWPIYYWAIWLAYAPLTGMFMAKISRGRTVRQFIFMNLLMPATFGLIWFSIFGGAAVKLQMLANAGVEGGIDLAQRIADGGLEVSVFAFFEAYPIGSIISGIFIITVFMSVVTLADSMTTTLASLSTTSIKNATSEPPNSIKVFWGVVMSSVAIINLIAGQEGEISAIDATKQIATVAGFPVLFLMVLIAAALVIMMVKRNKLDMVNNPDTADIPQEMLVKDEDEEVL